MKNVQAVLLIFANVEFRLWISTSGEGFQNLLRKNWYNNRTLPLTSCDCIYVAVWYNWIEQMENEFIAKFLQDTNNVVLLQLFLVTSNVMEGELVHF